MANDNNCTPVSLLENLSRETTQRQVLERLQGRLAVRAAIADKLGERIDPATAGKQLPDGHNVNVTNLDPGLAALRDALRGAGSKDLSTVQARLDVLGSEVTLLNIIGQQAMMLTKLGDIFGAVDGLEVTAGNIEFNAANINLQTDEVEAILREVRDRLKLGQSTNAVSSGVALSVEQQTILEALRDRQPSAPHLDRLKVADRFTGEEALEDKTSDGTVASTTFTFTQGAPDLVWVLCRGAEGRATLGGTEPSATRGWACLADTPTPITLSGQTVLKAFIETGKTVSVVGVRYS